MPLSVSINSGRSTISKVYEPIESERERTTHQFGRETEKESGRERTARCNAAAALLSNSLISVRAATERTYICYYIYSSTHTQTVAAAALWTFSRITILYIAFPRGGNY